MAADLRDFRGKITVETDVWLEAESRLTGRDKQEIVRVLLHERAATELLTDLVDAGYDGTLVSTDSAGTVLYEIRIGPFAELEEAQGASRSIAGASGLESPLSAMPWQLRQPPIVAR